MIRFHTPLTLPRFLLAAYYSATSGEAAVALRLLCIASSEPQEQHNGALECARPQYTRSISHTLRGRFYLVGYGATGMSLVANVCDPPSQGSFSEQPSYTALPPGGVLRFRYNHFLYIFHYLHRHYPRWTHKRSNHSHLIP